MYTPEQFRIKDFQLIREFIDQNGFGILISLYNGDFQDTHTPMYISDDSKWLYGHIAKKNPQWKGWNEAEKVKVIFHGSHTYISPNYYKSTFNVPTWNYTAVSIDGNIQIIDSSKDQRKIIRSLVKKYESRFPSAWTLDETNESMMNLIRGIVCFRISICNIEAKFKLNQNKSKEDQLSVIESLNRQGNHMDLQMAEQMEINLEKVEQPRIDLIP